MMMSEFIERTGFEPTAAEYEQIEEAYYRFDGDKNEFCKSWKQNGGIEQTCRNRAKLIEKLQSQIGELEKDLMKQINDLTQQLEREQEWRPHVDERNFSQKEYDHLASSGRIMTDAEAVRWIADEFGFREDKIKIIHEIPEYQINRHSCLPRRNDRVGPQHRRTFRGVSRSPAPEVTRAERTTT